MENKSFLLYGLFFAGAFILFSMTLFPHDRAGQRISAFLENALPGSTVRAGKTSFKFPPGLALADMNIEFNESLRCRLDRMVFSMNPISLLKQKNEIHFDAGIQGTRIQGAFISQAFLTPPFTDVTLTMSGWKVKDLKYANQSADVELSYEAGGDFLYPGEETPSRGKGHMIFSNVSIRVGHPVFKQMGIYPLVFDRVTVDFSMDLHGLFISRCVAKGQAMTLTLEGDILPEDRFDIGVLGRSTIQLKGYFQPGASYISKFAGIPALVTLFKDAHENGIPVLINGTVNHPKIIL